MDWHFVAAGLIVGVLVGLTGIGGSSLLAPLLILLGVKPIVAVGTDLAYSVPTKLLAAYLHGKQATIDRAWVKMLLIGGVPGVLAGVALLAVLRAHADLALLNLEIRHWIGGAILLACAVTVFVALRAWLGLEGTASVRGADGERNRLIAIGAAVGFLVAMTSIGSGSLTLPLMMLALPAATLRRLIGSEIAFAALLIPVAALGHTALGDVDVRSTLSLVAGSLPGALIGSRLSRIVSETWLRPVAIAVLAFAASRLLL